MRRWKHKRPRTSTSGQDSVLDEGCLGVLPDEVLLMIYAYLEPRELACLSCASRGLGRVAATNELWASTFQRSVGDAWLCCEEIVHGYASPSLLFITILPFSFSLFLFSFFSFFSFFFFSSPSFFFFFFLF